MVLKDITKNDFKQVKEIYLEAFPKVERKPFWILKHAVKSKKARILLASEDDMILGFIVMIEKNKMVMVDYLAVNNKVRSRGTGSIIMQKISEMYKDYRIVLLIEEINKDADNYDQRVSRRKFYVKNGFETANIFINGVSGKMEVLKKGKAVSKEEFLEMYRYALGNLFYKLSKVSIA